MTTAAPSLAAFLRKRKGQYLAAAALGEANLYVLAIGNEAGDLDSLASAVGYAWLASTLHHSPTAPLVQTSRADLGLRPENAHALSLAGLNPDGADLLCLSDLPSEPAHFSSSRIALVDHNRLSARFERIQPPPRVVGVVDHHVDEGLYRATADPRLIVSPTGSCASLVASLFQRLPAGGEKEIPPELAKLLLCAVLVDTNGLAPDGPARAADHTAAAFLAARAGIAAERALGGSITHPALQALNAELQARKASVAHLGTRDLLRRDYKELTVAHPGAGAPPLVVGLAAAPLGLDRWRAAAGAAFWGDVRAWVAERGLDALGVLTSFHDGSQRRREQLWVVPPLRTGAPPVDGMAAVLWAGLESEKGLSLRVLDEDDGVAAGGLGDGWEVKVYEQGNVRATRKTTAPVVLSIFTRFVEERQRKPVAKW